MKVWEISVKVYLKNDIHADFLSEELSKLVVLVLCKNPKYVDYHKSKQYKLYNLDSLYPIERDYNYKKGKNYTFRIRTIDKDIKDQITSSILDGQTTNMKVLSYGCRVLEKKTIEKVFTLTPVIIKNDLGYWKKHMDFSEFERRLSDNLIKKYKFVTKNEDIDENIVLFKNLSIDNRTPIAFKYKGVSLLGDKITINISEDPIIQDIFYMALGTGLGENNSQGCGFLNYRYL